MLRIYEHSIKSCLEDDQRVSRDRKYWSGIGSVRCSTGRRVSYLEYDRIVILSKERHRPQSRRDAENR